MLPFNSNNDFYEQFMSIPALKKDEENRLIIKAQGGDNKAQEKVLLHNIKSIIEFVKPCNVNCRYDENDLFQEGVIGMMKAIKTFDPQKGIPFKKYAMYNIKKQIKNYLDRNHFVQKVPLYLREIYSKIKKLETAALEDNNYYYMSPEELSKKLNLSEDLIKNCLDIYENPNNNYYKGLEYNDEIQLQ